MTVAPAGIARPLPTDLMRPFSTSTTGFVVTAPVFGSISRAARMAVVATACCAARGVAKATHSVHTKREMTDLVIPQSGDPTAVTSDPPRAQRGRGYGDCPGDESLVVDGQSTRPMASCGGVKYLCTLVPPQVLRELGANPPRGGFCISILPTVRGRHRGPLSRRPGSGSGKSAVPLRPGSLGEALRRLNPHTRQR